jgi:DNA recombination protein RmuC
MIETVLAFLGGAVVAGLAVWLLALSKVRSAEAAAAEAATRAAVAGERLAGVQREVEISRAEVAAGDEAVAKLRDELQALAVSRGELQTRLEDERRVSAEKLSLLEDAQTRLSQTFQVLASQALHANSQQLVTLARQTLAAQTAEARGDLEKRQTAIEGLVRPLAETLGRVDVQVQEMEKVRAQAYGALNEQVRALDESQRGLRTETANLVKALRQPQVRGRWGEMQLRRVVELAGMVAYCDFTEQDSVNTEEGRLRPDMVVRLPGGKSVVVDSKAPLKAFLDALESGDEAERARHLADHARVIRDHMTMLGQKRYWEQFQPTPEFVVMFLPGETFFAAALEQDPSLIERGVDAGVIVASPTTLIALLRAVYYGWRQEALTENARKISELGRELYDRLRVLGGHVDRVGDSLDRAVKAYNEAVSSLESRVLVSARRFTELGVAAKGEVDVLEPVTTVRKALRAPELLPAGAAEPPEEDAE